MYRTGQIEVIPLECGATRGPVQLLEAGRQGIVDLPAYAFLVIHPDAGMIIFDAGLPASLNGVRLADVFEVIVPAGQGLDEQLALHQVDAARIERLIISHSHVDHIAGVELVPNAQLIANKAEYEAAVGSVPWLRMGHDWKLIERELDVFGDGSVEVFPTPGHSCGHQSLRVRRGRAYDVLAVDSCYFCSSISLDDSVQPHAYDADAYRASLRLLRQMQDSGSFIVPGHDPAFLDYIPAGSCVVRPQSLYWTTQ